jgi:Mg-chelatase subunit ChlD
MSRRLKLQMTDDAFRAVQMDHAGIIAARGRLAMVRLRDAEAIEHFERALRALPPGCVGLAEAYERDIAHCRKRLAEAAEKDQRSPR